MAFLWSSYAQALPLNRGSSGSYVEPRKDSVYTDPTYGTSTEGRLAYGLVSFVCLFSLAFVLGIRAKRFEKKKLKFTWLLVHLQTLIALGLVISSSILVVTFGTTTQAQCFSAIMVCVAFYITGKICLYLFLLERAHVIRAPFIRKRTDDWVWVGGTCFVCVTFGAISIWGLITPHAELSPEDGQCRVGLSKIPGYLLLIFDASINAALTVLFVGLLRPVLKFREHTSTCHDHVNPPASVNRFRKAMRQLSSLGVEEHEGRDNFFISIKKVLWKNVIGSGVTFLASAANLIVFFAEKNNQLAFVCLVSCMADVTCGVLVVHWLTLGSNEEIHASPSVTRNHAPSLSSSSTIAVVSKPEDIVKPSKPEG
ncbi:hypothetical protein P171DRAFT_479033 [Karstenula rhodostoma CBS 690.94]|uniref:G-protein coupled receptors family 3 profile domain-containing protein n=1 Tax=Karstenula rhodostoma CBS 690.94 TaxID=1392251 RepID=A0A9P4Q008_9PLEO|nr:hypothetical protein P171DRAFT_479033 [Karstenula rhodostoma CBS 690.94]